jgi:hypothetical protein
MLGESVADVLGLAVPVREIVEHALLRRIIVGNGKRHHLRKR